MRYAYAIGTAGMVALSMTGAVEGQDRLKGGLPAWVDEVQTYGMLPVLPQRAKAQNVRVNGVWAGIGGADPILPVAKSIPSVSREFGSDSRAFVKACHDAGLIVPAIVNGLEGFPTLKETVPNLEEMACRGADGKPVSVGEFILMCTNNPGWLQWEIDFGKRAIDLDADLIHVDTPMASSFVSSGMLKAGFCEHCLARFRKHLEQQYGQVDRRQKFGLNEFSPDDIIRRLNSRQLHMGKQEPFLSTAPDDLLYREFIHCQEQASFETRKLLFDALRQYAAKANRQVAFSTNAADLGTQNPFGHWVRALMFADLVDLFIYEQDQLVNGFPPAQASKPPRGKWAAYHKLAHAIHHRRSPAVQHASTMGKILMSAIGQARTANTWLGVQCAEAYAANGAYVHFYVEPAALPKDLDEVCWAKAIETSGFVQSHRDLFEGDLRSGSPLAVLFLLNERGRTIPGVCPSYLGLAQALVEGNYPFDVLFGGDGRYVADRLTSQSLRDYKAILVPSPVDPTENQKRVICEFAKSGGTVICQEPEKLALTNEAALSPVADVECAAGQFAFGDGVVIRLKGEVTLKATNDVGSAFFGSHKPELRGQILQLAKKIGLHSTVDRVPDGLVSAFPILQPARKRIVVHIVNYDVDIDHDAVRQKTGLSITLPRNSLASQNVRGELYVDGALQPKPLEVTSTPEGLRCVIPRLGIFASLVFSE
ncbi:MAG: hypothetical protein ACT4QC_18300 [Planctomycetaceae bacterium]